MNITISNHNGKIFLCMYHVHCSLMVETQNSWLLPKISSSQLQVRVQQAMPQSLSTVTKEIVRIMWSLIGSWRCITTP